MRANYGTAYTVEAQKGKVKKFSARGQQNPVTRVLETAKGERELEQHEKDKRSG